MDLFRSLTAWDRDMLAHGLSDRTRRSYRYQVLRALSDQLAPPRSWKRETVATHIASLPPNGPGRATALQALRCYYRFLVQRGDVAEDPTDGFRIPHRKYRMPLGLSPDDLELLVSAAFARNERHGWTLKLLYYTGARVESLAALEPRDIDLGNAEIHFRRAKGGRTYSVPLSEDGLEAARACLRLRPAGSTTVLGVKSRTIWLWVRHASEDSGVPCHPHRIRHTTALALRRSGADVEVVRRVLGHESLTVTQRYFLASESEARTAVGRL